MSKIEKKIMSISIEFFEMDDLTEALHSLGMSLVKGNTSDREIFINSEMEWSITKYVETNFTEQVIDGNLCKVYQSSINQNKI